MAKPVTFRHHTGTFSYTTGVNGICIDHGLHWLLDFIAAQQKRIKKQLRFRPGQRWVHKVQFRRATIYCYPADSDDDPLIFPQKLYSDVTEPEITLWLEEDRLCLSDEREK